MLAIIRKVKDLKKARSHKGSSKAGHKYIKRTGAPGKYTYTYADDQGKIHTGSMARKQREKREEQQSKKKSGALSQAQENEIAKLKKQYPHSEYSVMEGRGNHEHIVSFFDSKGKELAVWTIQTDGSSSQMSVKGGYPQSRKEHFAYDPQVGRVRDISKPLGQFGERVKKTTYPTDPDHDMPPEKEHFAYDPQVGRVRDISKPLGQFGERVKKTTYPTDPDRIRVKKEREMEKSQTPGLSAYSVEFLKSIAREERVLVLNKGMGLPVGTLREYEGHVFKKTKSNHWDEVLSDKK